MAANPQLGDVSFEAGGKLYVLRLGTLALAVLEGETGVPSSQYFARPLDKWGVRDLRDVFISAMARHHPDLREAEICDIIDEIGLNKAGDLIAKALIRANGEASGGVATNGAENPPVSTGTH